MTPLVWGRRIIWLLFVVGLQHWKQRNLDGDLLNHQKESNLTRTRLLQNIQQFQSEDDDIPNKHRDFVYRDAEILDSYSNCNIRSWLKMAKHIVHVSKPWRRITVDILAQYWNQPPNVLNSTAVF